MSKLKPFVLGSLAGAAFVYASLQYHVVRSDNGFYLVERSPRAALGLAFADIRGLSEADLAARPELARAMSAHAARGIVSSEPPASEVPTTNPEMFDRARERLKATTRDWDSLIVEDVPKPPASELDAPMWNPFADDRAAEADDILGDSAPRDDAENPWPFGEDSPFADITDDTEQPRKSFVSRTEELADPFRQQSDSWNSDGVKPFDYNETFQKPQSTSPAKRPRGTVPLMRDHTDNLQRRSSSLKRRARDRYEQSRVRSTTDPIDSLIDQAESRASSVIDELVSPRNGESALDRAARNRPPQRYRRGN